VRPNRHVVRSISPQLWEEFFRGSRLACARLITKVENDLELIPEIRDRLIPQRKGAVRVGITGPPGVGKSTVAAGLARRAVKDGHSVGIIAVDPTSPFTGGAFLGDRVRMQSLMGDDRVFIRSLASRDGHGGLSPATPHVAEVLDAFGMDRIFIETVGVGQAELDVVTCADLILLVLQPGTGDVIQTLKAGITEAADLFLVNKADLPGTESLLEALGFLFEISAHRHVHTRPPILTASAVKDEGLDGVYSETERLIERLIQSGQYQDKKRQQMEREIRESLQQMLWDRFAAMTNAPEEIRILCERLIKNGQSPYPFIQAMDSNVRMELVNQRAGNENDG